MAKTLGNFFDKLVSASWTRPTRPQGVAKRLVFVQPFFRNTQSGARLCLHVTCIQRGRSRPFAPVIFIRHVLCSGLCCHDLGPGTALWGRLLEQLVDSFQLRAEVSGEYRGVVWGKIAAFRVPFPLHCASRRGSSCAVPSRRGAWRSLRLSGASSSGLRWTEPSSCLRLRHWCRRLVVSWSTC